MSEIAGLTDEAVRALEARGLCPETATLYGIGSPVRGGGGDAIAIPFVRDGKTVNTKFRTFAPKKFWQTAGGVQCAWNEDTLRDDTLRDQPLIITEGELDALAAICAGYPRVISVPGGAPAPGSKDDGARYRWIDEIRPLLALERVKEIILAVDNDAPGAQLLHDLSLRLGRYRCKFVTYPKQQGEEHRLKDLNEVLQIYGPPGVRATISRAQFLKVDGIFRMSELPPVPDVPIYDIGIPKLRDHYKARLGDFAVWTGIPSHGKSSLVNDVCCRLAQAHGLVTAFASFEQSPQRDHRRNLRTWYCRRPVQHCDSREIREADAWIDRQFSFVVPGEDDDVTLDWMLDKLEAAVVQHAAKVVVIDPWNELDHARRKDETQTEYVGRAIKTLKRFARTMCVHLIVVAHPAKQQKDPQTGDYRMPTLYDISDSAHWYNKADLGVVVHRTAISTQIRVAKSRYHDEIGTPGEVEAQFQFDQRRYDVP